MSCRINSIIDVLQSAVSSIVTTSLGASVLGVGIISRMTVLLLPAFLVLASFDSRSALAFCSL
ncbi:hypothetical protein A2U01_0099776, partial [Trifolium medium]|nr:hypothetical protein [Trifolium medium]